MTLVLTPTTPCQIPTRQRCWLAACMICLVACSTGAPAAQPAKNAAASDGAGHATDATTELVGDDGGSAPEAAGPVGGAGGDALDASAAELDSAGELDCCADMDAGAWDLSALEIGPAIPDVEGMEDEAGQDGATEGGSDGVADNPSMLDAAIADFLPPGADSDSADSAGEVGSTAPGDSTGAAGDGDQQGDGGQQGDDASSVPTLPLGAPADTNLIVQVVGTVEGLSGLVKLVLEGSGGPGGLPGGLPPEGGGGGPPEGGGGPTGPKIAASQQGSLPMTFYLHFEPGQYQLMVWVVGASGYNIAGGMTCTDGGPGKIAVEAGKVTQVTINVAAIFGPVSVSKVCSLGAKTTYTSLLTQSDVIFTPPTKDGAAHFMQGLVWDTRLWVAGSQDGLVSFDFPLDIAKTPPLAAWTVWGGAMCNRTLRLGDVLYCSSRNGYIHMANLGLGQKILALDKVWLAGNGDLGTEGMVNVDGYLYVAVHRKGIWRLNLSLSNKPYVIDPPADTDIWDVKILDASHLVVGSDQGVHVLDLQAAGAGQAPWGAWVATPGPAANLHVSGATVWVGDLGGLVHAVDMADPASPVLLGSVRVPSSVYGLWADGTRAYAGAGHYAIAIDLPALGKGPLLVRDASPSPRFSLDMDPLDSQTMMASEFQDVRRIHVEQGLSADRAVLMVEAEVGVGPAAIGSNVSGIVRVYNAGQVPAVVLTSTVQETPSVLSKGILGPWVVAPGALVSVPFTMNKTVKGVTDHVLRLTSDVAEQSALNVPLNETTWLHPGDVLPPLAYKTLEGKLVDVNATLQGQVGVVLVAAHSCPVGFMAMAAAARQLGPMLDKGQIAAVAINPWDDGQAPEVPLLKLPMPMLHTPLTTQDSQVWSEIMDVTLGQPTIYGPPMPIVYIVGKTGKIAMAMWGYQPLLIEKILAEELAK